MQRMMTRRSLLQASLGAAGAAASAGLVGSLVAPAAYARTKLDPISSTPLADDLFLIEGAGANVVVAKSGDGLLLVDGGFNKNDDTEWAATVGVKVYGPPVKSKHNTDPYAPRSGDGPGVTAWRKRMKSPHGKGVYRRRAMGECINARFRQWNLYQFTVRGRQKVNTVLHWFALANNILAGHRLRAAAA